ncbi:hypothetical protein OQA88_12177 [Cercophora sp. LCS_1]
MSIDEVDKGATVKPAASVIARGTMPQLPNPNAPVVARGSFLRNKQQMPSHHLSGAYGPLALPIQMSRYSQGTTGSNSRIFGSSEPKTRQSSTSSSNPAQDVQLRNAKEESADEEIDDADSDSTMSDDDDDDDDDCATSSTAATDGEDGDSGSASAESAVQSEGENHMSSATTTSREDYDFEFDSESTDSDATDSDEECDPLGITNSCAANEAEQLVELTAPTLQEHYRKLAALAKNWLDNVESPALHYDQVVRSLKCLGEDSFLQLHSKKVEAVVGVRPEYLAKYLYHGGLRIRSYWEHRNALRKLWGWVAWGPDRRLQRNQQLGVRKLTQRQLYLRIRDGHRFVPKPSPLRQVWGVDESDNGSA